MSSQSARPAPVSVTEMHELLLVQRMGPLGVKINKGTFEPLSRCERIISYAGYTWRLLTRQPQKHLSDVEIVTVAKVAKVNQWIHDVEQVAKKEDDEKVRESNVIVYSNISDPVRKWNTQLTQTGCTTRISRCLGTALSPKPQLRIAYQGFVRTVDIGGLPTFQKIQESLVIDVKPLVIDVGIIKVPFFYNGMIRWAKAHSKDLQKAIKTHGAIQFRGFPINNAEDFREILKVILGRPLKDYVEMGGDAARQKIDEENVYEVTPNAPDFLLGQHNELSVAGTSPEYISFYCEVPPPPGTGQTALFSNVDITHSLKQRKVRGTPVWDWYQGKTLTYISRHPPAGSFVTRVTKSIKSWQDAFGTTDPKDIQALCEKRKWQFKWTKGWLEVRRTVPATRTNDKGEEVWFSQANILDLNPKNMGRLNYILAKLFIFNRQYKWPYEVRTADDKPLPRDVVYATMDCTAAPKQQLDWNAPGTFMIVNNLDWTHGKFPYPTSAKRTIRVAMS
ncbi:MAG: TauD/TfdA family dioxygenase [Parachlamydiaceae bacterium]|nr:TauD/TfdA family dioxygenase [Parachlamydiaceae bacterium]